MSWPTMEALDRQRIRDIESAPDFEPVGYGLLQKRQRRFSKRVEYGMGKPWLVLRVGKWALWMRLGREAR